MLYVNQFFRSSMIEENGQLQIFGKMVNIGIIKMGNLGMSQVINLIQDEMAAREGITVRAFGTGAKMGLAEAMDTESFKQWHADVMIIISPDATAPGPTALLESWKNVPCIVISDGPEDMTAKSFGASRLRIYYLVGRSVGRAKREFNPVGNGSLQRRFNESSLDLWCCKTYSRRTRQNNRATCFRKVRDGTGAPTHFCKPREMHSTCRFLKSLCESKGSCCPSHS